MRRNVFSDHVTESKYTGTLPNFASNVTEKFCNACKHARNDVKFAVMERHLTAGEAWQDFWRWIREPEQADRWRDISREEKNYLGKADIHHRQGKLGDTRIKNALEKYAPDRYTAVGGFIVKE